MPNTLLSMARRTALAAPLALLLTATANAALVDATFSATFDGGHTLQGQFTFDDTFATVTAKELGATNGLEELTVSFFDPSAVLLGTFDNVDAGVSTYEYLAITFDTATLSFTGNFDVGSDANPGDYYAYIDLGTGYLRSKDSGPIDSVTPLVIDVARVPVPAPLALFAAGLIGLRLTRR